MTKTLDRITRECMENSPPAGSSARAIFESGLSQRGMDGFLLIEYANLSAVDHVRAFASLIRGPGPRATALATLTRGTLESLGRSWFLLDHQDLKDFVHKAVSMLFADLRYPAKNNDPIWTRGGAPLNASDQRESYAAELRSLGLPRPSPIEMGAMVAALLDSELKDGGGRDRYSSLSAIAHAHRLAINGFIATDASGDKLSLFLPRQIAAQMCLLQLLGMSGVVTALARLFGNQPRHQDLIRAANDRSFSKLEEIWTDEEDDLP